MLVLDTKHKRKSAAITLVILLALLYLIFNYGMGYLDPPVEYGIAVNYGVSDVGKGEPKVIENIKATPQTPVKEEKVQEEVVKEEIPEEIIKEEVITSDNKDVPIVEKPKKEEKKEVPKKEIKEEKATPKKPSEDAQKAFDNLLNGDKSDGEPKGEGDDDKDGLKGKENGDPNSSKYYGNTGSTDGDPNYSLNGRRALTKPKEQPDCQQTGIVVVTIWVDKTGKVTRAEAGAKGTTNSHKCLLEPAKKAAMSTTWNPASDAPDLQKGKIIYNFTLTK